MLSIMNVQVSSKTLTPCLNKVLICLRNSSPVGESISFKLSLIVIFGKGV